MTKISLKEAVLAFMRQQTYAPLKLEDLLEAMNFKGSEMKDFWQSLKELEENGEVIKTRFNTYGLPERMGLVVGRFQLTTKGFGFVIPDNKGAKPDVFIPPNSVGGAMNNDRVMARIESLAGASKPEGEIIRIINRANSRVVGIFSQNGDYAFVTPDDKRIGQDVYIAAKDFHGAKSDQKVVVEITVWPEHRRSIEGKVIEVLGNIGDAGLEILSIIKQNDLPLEFPASVSLAAQKIHDKIYPVEFRGRRDLRKLPIVTVDGEDAKDLDDAVYVEKQGKEWLLGVYIADVSHYVREDSVIDKEACNRGTSVYLVDRVLPMLPEKLCNGICSLNAGEDRLSMSCQMLIDANGTIINYEIFPAVIKVLHRLSYNIVKGILVEDNAELKKQYADILPMLKEMEVLCGILRAKRLRRGAIDFDLPEQKVILDEKKYPVEIIQLKRSIAESIIEEFMLSANETVALHMAKQKWPFIYRVHDVPNADKMENLSKLLHNFAINLPVSEEMKPLVLQKALAQMLDKPEEKMVSTVALRSLKQAVYQTDNVGHFGLAAEYYTHFTSPIRRYPDLIVHRLLRAWLVDHELSAKKKEKLVGKLDEIAQHASIRERIAADAERDTVELKKTEYMQGFVGEEFTGIISGITAFGMFVELPNGVEGLVHISSLTDDYYEYVEAQYSLIGEHLKKVYRLGDSVTIEVLQVNVTERQIDFVLAGENAGVKNYLRSKLDHMRELQERKQDVRKNGSRYSKAKKKAKKGNHEGKKRKNSSRK